MTRLTFLGHSGFLLQLDSLCLLFDWWTGDLPPLPQGKPLLVFASHRHEDHFNPAIFALDDGHRPVRFLLGKDIKLTERNRARWGLSDETLGHCLSLGGNECAEPLSGVTVQTLPSTDEGVAFLVRAEGQTIFHAGDLNWWHWEGEALSWNRNMEVSFKRYCQPLQGMSIDLALLPLDPRLGTDGYRGPRYFLENAHIERMVPMHQWGDFAYTDAFLAAHPQWRGTVLPVHQVGETIEL